MMASQRGLDVTGQNLSNINTDGYTRQRLDLTSLNPVGNSIGSSSYDAKVGQGVMMVGVSQIRDPFLDIQYRNELPKVGTVEAKESILESIGTIFDEADSEAIRTRLSAVVSQLTNLATPENAGSGSADALVRSACEVLLDSFHQNGTSIENVKGELIDKMERSVMPQLETYFTEIVNLNVSIRNSQILGNPALELQDQRNQMLDELASYMPIDVTYNTKNMGGGTLYFTPGRHRIKIDLGELQGFDISQVKYLDVFASHPQQDYSVYVGDIFLELEDPEAEADRNRAFLRHAKNSLAWRETLLSGKLPKSAEPLRKMVDALPETPGLDQTEALQALLRKTLPQVDRIFFQRDAREHAGLALR